MTTQRMHDAINTALDELEQRLGREHEFITATRDALTFPRKGTMREWFENHDVVTTVQWTMKDNRLTDVWAPGSREVDATRATSVTLDGSTREYAGCRVVAAGPETLVVITEFGSGTYQVILYATL